MFRPTPSSDGRIPSFIIGGVLVVFGVVLFWTGAKDLRLAQELKRSGRSTNGSIDSVRASKSLTVSYEYEVDGVTFYNNATLQGNINSTIGPGQPILVRYLPNHPSSSLCSLEDQDSPGYSKGNEIVGVFIVVASLLVLGFAVFGKSAARMLVR